MQKYNAFYTPIFFALLTIGLFWQFFFKGLHPFPGNYMLAWYEPFKSENLADGSITIPHKPVAHDVFRQLYPFKLLGSESLRKFTLPLWNPYNGAGQPHFAVMHMGYLNPLNVIFLILSPPLSWSLQVILQPLLIGLATYYYLASLRASKLGAIFGGVSFMFSGFVVTRTLYNDYNFAIIATVLSLTIIEKYISGNKKIIYILPVLVFLIICTTQPQLIAYCLALLISYAYLRKVFIKTIIFILIGIGLSAIQILPTIELYLLSNLTVESSKFIIERFLLPPFHLMSFFIPNYFGNVATYNYWGAGDYIESIATIGLIAVFFSYITVLAKDKLTKDIKTFFLATIILSIFLSIKSPITSFLYSLPIPIFSTGIPSRILVLASFSISVLAGLGFSNVFESKFRLKNNINLLSFLLIPLAIISLTIFLLATKADCGNVVITNCRTIAVRNTILEFSVFVIVFIIIFISKVNVKNIKMIVGIIIIGLTSMVGIYNGQKFLPFAEQTTFAPNNELINKTREIAKLDRIAGFGDANLKTNFATLFRFYDNNYYDPLYIKRYGELVAYSSDQSVLKRSDIEFNGDINISAVQETKRKRLLELTSTKYLLYKASDMKSLDNIVWKNDKWIIVKNDALPRAYLVQDVETEAKSEKILKALFKQNFDPFTTAIIEKTPTLKLSHKENLSKPIIEQYNNEFIKINTSIKSNSLLVLTDNFYPGWNAYINGKRTRILRANYTFRAVEIPAGNNKVEFKYEPESLTYGATISIATIFLWAFIYKKNLLA